MGVECRYPDTDAYATTRSATISGTMFSVVMPMRDTPQERRFAAKSIPAILGLDPTEFIIGVDSNSLDEHIRDHYGDIRVIHVGRSPAWGFQLANVMWSCYNACQYDTILTTFVDTVVRRDILRWRSMVGCDGVAVVSPMSKLALRTPGDMIRSMYYRFCTKSPHGGSSGAYWVYRPYYMDAVSYDGFRQIRNGTDIYMYEQIWKHGQHHAVILSHDLGSDSMDCQNGDLPWVQFQMGIWQYANVDRYRRERLQYQQTMSSPRRAISRMLAAHPEFRLWLLSVATWHPWMYAGWRWAARHPDHKAVTLASTHSYPEYNMMGSDHIRDIRDWGAAGKTGTGF